MNIFLVSVVSAVVGMFGYLFLGISDIREAESAQRAMEFTSKEASELTTRLTDVMTDIDVRIRLIERDIDWMKSLPRLSEPTPDGVPAGDGSAILPDPPAPPPEVKRSPRYDVRQSAR